MASVTNCAMGAISVDSNTRFSRVLGYVGKTIDPPPEGMMNMSAEAYADDSSSPRIKPCRNG